MVKTNNMYKFDLGTKLKDAVTGFEGIATFRIQFLTGCDQYGINPGLNKEGERRAEEQFDENRLIVMKGGVKLPEETIKQKQSGGHQPRIEANRTKIR